MPRARSVYDYDLIVIGSGSGGGVAAHIVNRKGKKVAIVEDDTIGGECPNYGCVPTKALLQAAEVYEEAKEGKKFGVRAPTVSFNMTSIKKWKDLAVYRTGTSIGDKAYEAEGIHVIKGRAHFVGKHEISVGRKRYTAAKFLVATGNRNFVPPIPGLEDAGYITHREAIELTRLPKSLFVIGGGAIGCEFAQFFSALGSKVHIAERSPRLLSKEDAEIGASVATVFGDRYNISVYTGASVTKVGKAGNKKVVHVDDGNTTHVIKVDEVLLAAGMLANVDLGLENAGVKYTPRNIIVNNEMRTTAKHVWAAGDVAGPYMFTHMATYQSRLAAHNMFHRTKVVARYHAVPRCVFVFPEIASAGLTEAEAREKYKDIKIGLAPISIIGRSHTSDERTGFVKVMATAKGRIIGASIIAPRAGEMIHELTLAINVGLKAEDVAATIHAFPTWSEAVRIACAKIE